MVGKCLACRRPWVPSKVLQGIEVGVEGRREEGKEGDRERRREGRLAAGKSQGPNDLPHIIQSPDHPTRK